MNMAQDLATKLMTEQGSEVAMSKGSRIHRVRATADQVKALEALFKAKAKILTACDNTPP